MLAGWGTFNLVEGAVYHHVLRLHRVHDWPAYDEIYDWSCKFRPPLPLRDGGWQA